MDHVTGWIRDGKPSVLVAQPYALSSSDRADLVRIGEEWNLDVQIGETSWYGHGTTFVQPWEEVTGPRRLRLHLPPQRGPVPPPAASPIAWVSETFTPFRAMIRSVPGMRLGYVIHYVDDPTATVGFYEAAFGLARGFVHESGQFAEMDSGSTRLAFTSHALGAESVPVPYTRSRPDADPAGYELTLLCEDVPAAYARAVAAGAASVAEPHHTAWGQTVAYVRDRDGALVGLATPIA